MELHEDMNNAGNRPATELPFDANARPIWEVLAELGAKIPADAWAKVPPDTARHIQHYLYGSPKED